MEYSLINTITITITIIHFLSKPVPNHFWNRKILHNNNSFIKILQKLIRNPFHAHSQSSQHYLSLILTNNDETLRTFYYRVSTVL